MKKNELEVSPIPEYLANTKKITEIKFDCLVTMHDIGVRDINGGLLHETKRLSPQWFRAKTELTLEMIKYNDEYTIGCAIKELFYELERTIKNYENS